MPHTVESAVPAGGGARPATGAGTAGPAEPRSAGGGEPRSAGAAEPHSAGATQLHPGGPTDTGAPTAGRRERKKQETRAALEAAALRLFAEHGYEHTTVEDIADAADVAVRTFFRYFSSKRHVLFGDVAHTIVGRLRAALAARPVDEPPIQAVRAAMDAVDIDDYEQHSQIVARMRLVQQLPELLPAYEMVFRELHEAVAEFVAARTGEPVTALFPQVLAGAATLAGKASLCDLDGPDASPATLRELRHRAYDALTAGLAALAA